MKKLKILTVFGTRPEVIKLAPFIKAIEVDPDCISVTCATSQQKKLQNDALSLFGINTNYNLEIMKKGQDLFYITESIMHSIKAVLDIEKPDFTVVHGDTTTAFVAALSSFYRKIPIVHIEAGLRTKNIYSPYPEEANRTLISRIASLHMAPNQNAIDNLAKEDITQNVFKIGNTIIDSIDWILNNVSIQGTVTKELIQSTVNKVLITVHRRENFGDPLIRICAAIKEIARIYSEYLFIWPLHPNPNINNYVQETLSKSSNIKICDPLSYPELLNLLKASLFILSDSGGIQEEACIFGKKILILREETERPEVIELGLGQLVGSSQRKIVLSAKKLLSEPNLSTSHERFDYYGKPGVSLEILSVIKKAKIFFI